MNLNKLYDQIIELQKQIEKEIVSPINPSYTYQIKALAACYELQDYLAGKIEEQKR